MSEFLDDLGDDADGVDKLERQTKLPPGFYRVKLVSALDSTSRQKETQAYELMFEVIDGPFAGATITDKLWRTDAQFCKDRIKLFAVRLGLLKRSADGKKLLPVEGKTDFKDCLGAEMALEVIHEADQKDPNKSWPRFAPNGAHDLNSSKIKDILVKGGKPIGTAKTAAGQGKGSTVPTTSGDKPAPTSPAPAKDPRKDARRL